MNGTIQPWTGDAGFQQAWAAVSGHTLLSIDRAWMLWMIVRQLAPVPGALIEVGSWKGGSGALLALAQRSVGDELPVYLCDTFRGVVKAGPMDSVYRGGEHAEGRESLDALARTLDLGPVRVLDGVFPEETAHLIRGAEFRLAHIDVDVYQSALDAIAWIWPRLSPGGVAVFDDYGFPQCAGVRHAVDEFAAACGGLLIYNRTGQAVLVKR